MSIPLERLYDFLHSVDDDDTVIYRFLPHGSKKITNLVMLSEIQLFTYSRFMICHDQEPLEFSTYGSEEVVRELRQHPKSHLGLASEEIFREILPFMIKLNIRMVNARMSNTTVLLHSEKRSIELAKYEQSGLIGVYWWCHAIIARDWFRFAKHDTNLPKKDIQKNFLIYNRAWLGTREYRLRFAEMVVQQGLVAHCAMKFNPVDSGSAYDQHQYRNSSFKIATRLEDYFELNTADAKASADYVALDYATTGIEVVLETLFDDARWHLTEKTLRPIACGQPFLLVATAGSLEYLRSHGFRTFAGLLDETYDTILDPVARLEAITAEMQRIVALLPSARARLYRDLQPIAEHNKRLFFSDAWHDSIIQEYRDNLAQARKHIPKNIFKSF